LFRKNKLTLKLNKFSYSPGEIIEGSFTIDLKKYYEVRKIQASLIGRRRERYTNGEGKIDYHFVNVFDFTIPLASEGNYQYQQFHFKIKIPSTILEQCDKPSDIDPDTTLGKIQGIARAMNISGIYPVEWLVQAHMDIPMKIDLKEEQEIIISE
jgi:hypothetical protein